jgi:hypothetical protein
MRFAKLFLPLLTAAAVALAGAANAQPKGVMLPLAERLAVLGFQPLGAAEIATPVHRVEQTLTQRSSASLVVGGAEQPLVLGAALKLDLSYPAAGRIDAPMIFVGYGLSAPGAGYDDFSGRNLKGRVLVAVEGAPEGLSETDAARAREAYTRAALRKSGALGLIVIREAADAASGVYVDDGAKENQPFAASLSPALAETLFQNSGYSFAEVQALVKARRPVAGFALSTRFKARFETRRRNLDERAVLAVLPGADPALASEYVLAAVHVGPLGEGAEALETLAARLKAEGPARRPVILAAFNDSADGGAAARTLLQARLGAARVAAAFSIAPSEVAEVRGAAESSLGAAAERTARLHRVSLAAAPLAAKADPVAADAPMLALARPVFGAEGFDAWAAALIHATAAAPEAPRWAPGAAFAPPPQRAMEIDGFQLRMPISMKRIRAPSGLG